jgi:copper resistance protein C
VLFKRLTRLAATLALLPLATPAAFAHAILVDSQPAPESSIAAGHVVLTLRYNSRIDHNRSRLTLLPETGDETKLPIADGTPADVLRTETDLKPGSYTLRWQVLAIDGHITRGNLPFTVTGK